ncbi:ROK family protein [Corynebacterium sp. zg912]|uniref:ROK family protein n=1 Tax=Corynebacterium wankanglinii TaxID=2735136 RepID=A0A7H0K951_9CORY|nr:MULTISPECIES: ROK family protein [Corynebacterium]MBA1837274.1 ROK family protein [Corynebacterium wankanglinii]MCR5928248.1 ROK family protein [Corynebacterium sp. zg912]QNP93817.1 ROK family protein [Corynebacterium wankanglinii]
MVAHSRMTVGFDIGGTNARAAVVDRDGAIVDSLSTRTPHDAEGLTQMIVEMVGELRAQHDIGAVGVAVAGFLDPACEVVRFAPHLAWRDDQPVRRDLEAALGLPVRLEHDANSAAWGEYRYGAGRDLDTWVFFAVGTGIGATLMHRGEIYRGAFGTAPEFGHITVVPGGRACSCGKQGCLERYASGTSLVDCAIDIATKGSFKDSGVYRAVVEKRASGHDIMAAARDGDQLGLAALESFSTWLGRGLAIVADVLDPAQIVLGGGVSEDADLFLLSAQRSMEANIVGAGYRPLPEILCAELGSRAGMIGVADLARELL